MTDWQETAQGWVATHPLPESIERAKALRAQRDAEGVPSIFLLEDDHRWVGDLAELGFESWLHQNGVEYQRFGGVDDNPDFTVGPWGVGLKCRTSTYAMVPTYIVNVPERHLRRENEKLLFFAAWEKRAGRLVLLGVISRRSFDEESFDVGTGEQLHRGRRAAAGACRNVHVNKLASPREFLARVS